MPEGNKLLQQSRGKRFISHFLVLSACALFVFALSPTRASAWVHSAVPPSSPAHQTAKSQSSSIAPGTILPVVLRTTISPERAKQGQIVRGQIAQDVPLPNGSKIPKGSKVEGQVVEVVPAANGAGAKISIRFDKLYWQGQTLPITTDLRAIAGFMEVSYAGVPNQAIGEGDVAEWMTTTQIGGDSVFGRGGEVTSAHDATEVVGNAPMSGGVLVRLSPNESAHCRGALDGNTSPQALWVFSSDACGTYGLENVSISHAGRTDPLGTITLELQSPKAKIANGAGMLLRVIS